MRSMEEKVKRLQELSPFKEEYTALTWLRSARTYPNLETWITTTAGSLRPDSDRAVHARATWDVHTGVAFTKLYKALR
jgi:hypothetical protein